MAIYFFVRVQLNKSVIRFQLCERLLISTIVLRHPSIQSSGIKAPRDFTDLSLFFPRSVNTCLEGEC
jgi:hypothetical protein